MANTRSYGNARPHIQRPPSLPDYYFPSNSDGPISSLGIADSRHHDPHARGRISDSSKPHIFADDETHPTSNGVHRWRDARTKATWILTSNHADLVICRGESSTRSTRDRQDRFRLIADIAFGDFTLSPNTCKRWGTGNPSAQPIDSHEFDHRNLCRVTNLTFNDPTRLLAVATYCPN